MMLLFTVGVVAAFMIPLPWYALSSHSPGSHALRSHALRRRLHAVSPANPASTVKTLKSTAPPPPEELPDALAVPPPAGVEGGGGPCEIWMETWAELLLDT